MDATPQTSPVLVAIDERGRAVVSTRQTARKVPNLRRDPRVWLCAAWGVLRPLNPDRWHGRGSRIRPKRMEGLMEYYRRVSGAHPDRDDRRAAMERAQRVLPQVALSSAGPDRVG